jgi:hypothetical protein
MDGFVCKKGKQGRGLGTLFIVGWVADETGFGACWSAGIG